MISLVDVKKIFGAVVGTARFASGAATAVRVAFSGATSVVGRPIAHVPPDIRAMTPQRCVLTIDGKGAPIR
jgi:hypothetical protein